MPDFHAVLAKRSDQRSYIAVLTPTAKDEDLLFTAKDKIRDRLRREIPIRTTPFGEAVKPRFYVQGSWAYKTCNRPCQPQQEMDLDLGVYLPISAWEDHGIAPKKAASLYFQMIESIVAQLADEEGWRLDKEKETCVRLGIVGASAHIDVPLYVAPDKQFNQIVEVRMQRLAKAAMTVDFAQEALAETLPEDELDEQTWLEFDTVALAKRDGEWAMSDPRKVSRWFDTAVHMKGGEQLRRICQYLKAMRDYRWESGGPTSLMLMICAEQVWDDGIPDRDDLALLKVLRNIADNLAGPVFCPEISDEDFNRCKDTLDLQQFKQWALDAESFLREVITNSVMHDLDTAFTILQAKLDHRFQMAAKELVKVDATAAGIRSTPASVLPQPQHRSSEAG